MIMKNVVRFLSFLVLVLLSGCNSSDAYKEQVQALDDNWEASTENLEMISKSAEQELNSWETMYKEMYGADVTAMTDMPEDRKQTLDSLDAVCKSHGDKYRLINQEISELKELWVQNTKLVDEINERLENNSLSKENLNAINQLNDQAIEVDGKINTWKTEIAAIKEECAATCQAASGVIEKE
jgi:chromosome segregation ATPase